MNRQGLKKKSLLALALFSFALSGCSIADLIGGQSVGSGGTDDTSNLAKYTLSNLQNLSALQKAPLNSIGNRKILVVPVYFSNSSAYTSSELNTIEKAYNGKASETGWQSLQSYYYTSSYGKLTITSTVASPYQYPGTDLSFQNQVNSNATSVGALADTILKSLASSYTLSDYDQDKDGYIDGFEMVYKSSYTWDGKNGSSTEVWWNYTSLASSKAGSLASPNVGIYFWSQLSRLSNGYYKSTIDIDTHTLVHETGHMLGLDDYYSYDDNECPAGCADMMDFNIGDHDAFSKMLLGWVTPKVIDGSSSSFSLTLNSFTETGDCVLLRNTTSDKWNGTPYDEYLLLQYYTPTGLNERDSKGYAEYKGIGTGGLYKNPGLQVFHVDARIIDGKIASWSQADYTDSPDAYSFRAFSNTGSYSIDLTASRLQNKAVGGSAYRLIKALPASGVDIYGSSKAASYLGLQSSLFSLPSYGGGSTTYTNTRMMNLFPNGKQFNDGSTLNYSFTVSAQTDSTITLLFQS